MVLSYKNNSSNHILNKLIDVRYSNRQMLFGFDNNITITYGFDIDVMQIALQADIFSRQMYSYRSLFDFKRFLGSYQDDWLRLLHEAYVYDRVRCIYYGLNSNNLMKSPEDVVTFPGHCLMFNFLVRKTFQFSIDDSQPRSIFTGISTPNSAIEALRPVFQTYPDLEEGISQIPGVYTYFNFKYESILRGLKSGLTYLNSRKEIENSKDLFFTVNLDDQNISGMTNPMSNPILNSHLSEDCRKFYFINPVSVSGPGKMRFNESLYISRAIGMRSDQLTLESNNFYNVAVRDYTSDFLTREEVYAITGIKSEIVPYSWQQILNYLGIDTYRVEAGQALPTRVDPSLGGNNTGTP